MHEILIRFLVGGFVVSLFAVIGSLFKPTSFGGLFGAAPSVALATLGLTLMTDGRQFAAQEARSMVLGAMALLAYAVCVRGGLLHVGSRSLAVTVYSMPVWFLVAFSLWYLLR